MSAAFLRNEPACRPSRGSVAVLHGGGVTARGRNLARQAFATCSPRGTGTHGADNPGRPATTV